MGSAMPRSRMKAMPISQAMKAAKPAARIAAGREGSCRCSRKPGSCSSTCFFCTVMVRMAEA